MTAKYKGLDNRNLRLLNISDAELSFQKHRQFIWIWSKSKSLTQAARKLRLTSKQASVKAGFIRRLGVPLKTFNSSWKKISEQTIHALSLIAEELNTPPMDYEKFVRLWQTVGPGAVMAEFNINRNRVTWICSWLRTRCKINLKIYRPRLDKKALRRIADETLISSSPKVPPHKQPSSPE